MAAASLVKSQEKGRGLQFQEKVLRSLVSTLSKDSLSTSWTNNSNQFTTSVMIIIAGASLSEQHTDILICHCTKQDLSRTSRYLGTTYDKPTVRTAIVSVSTYARTTLYTKVISCISDVIAKCRLC